MLNGVGGLRVRWSPLVRSDESIKGLWKKEERENNEKMHEKGKV